LLAGLLDDRDDDGAADAAAAADGDPLAVAQVPCAAGELDFDPINFRTELPKSF
jgi:hypothetical protein